MLPSRVSWLFQRLRTGSTGGGSDNVVPNNGVQPPASAPSAGSDGAWGPPAAADAERSAS